MEHSSHRIRSQRWQVRAGSPDEAFAWRKFLHHQGDALLAPLLDQALCGLAPDGVLLHIPRLCLELKVASTDELADMLPGVIRRQLAAQLHQERESLPAGAALTAAWQETPLAESRLQMLLHYLRSGSLPWQHAPSANGHGENVAGLLQEICRDELLQLIGLLRHERVAAPLLFRLLQLLPDADVDTTAGSLLVELDPSTAPERPVLAQVLARLLATLRRCSLPRQRYLDLVAEMLAAALGGSDSSTTDRQGAQRRGIDSHCQSLFRHTDHDEALAFLRALAATLPAEAGEIVLRLGPLLTESPAAGSNPRAAHSLFAAIAALVLRGGTSGGEIRTLVRGAGESFVSALLAMFPASAMDEVLQRHKNEEDAASGPSHSQGALPDGSAPGAGEWGVVEPDRAPERHATVENARQPLGMPGQQERTGTDGPLATAAPRGDAIPPPGLFPLLVRQAGLILLHPYITRFLVRCHVLAAGDSALPPALLPRAAALLQQLISGEDAPYEFELGLIKVLLGLRPEEPLLVAAGLISEQDRQEATALLQSVIAHWQALKNTSVPGLRSSFLQRPALLRETENGWQLRVERRPFDLLLEQLPWGFGIVKLPWMPRAIFTEW